MVNPSLTQIRPKALTADYPFVQEKHRFAWKNNESIKFFPPEAMGSVPRPPGPLLVANLPAATVAAASSSMSPSGPRAHPSAPRHMAQGKRRRLMDPEPWMRFHPFVATLEQWATGVPVDCGGAWSQAAIETAVTRGPHTSALTPDARLLIAEEMEYQVNAGFSEILPWAEVRKPAPPPQLKVSPLAVIP